MTKQQQIQIERIRKEVENFGGAYKENYEIKEFQVEEMNFGVSLYVEVGLKNDEGTLASALCRDNMMVFIGPKGGLRVPCVDKKTYNMVYKKYTSFIGACLDYNGR